MDKLAVGITVLCMVYLVSFFMLNYLLSIIDDSESPVPSYRPLSKLLRKVLVRNSKDKNDDMLKPV